MVYLKRSMIFVAAMALLVLALPPAYAVDNDNWKYETYFESPVRIGDFVLQPGTYQFKLTPGSIYRGVVMIYDVDNQEWKGMVMGIYRNRKDMSGVAERTSFILERDSADNMQRVKYWFYHGWDRGIAFVYPSDARTWFFAER